jgi:cell division protein FtsX
MKKMTLFKVAVVLVLCFVGLGFYQGWFVLSSQGSNDGSNKVDVNLTLDPDKAKEDAEKVETKARDLTGTSAEKTPTAAPEDGVKSKTN